MMRRRPPIGRSAPVAAALLGLLLSGCALFGPRPPETDKPGPWIENGCLIDSIAFDDARTASQRLDGSTARHGVILCGYLGADGARYGHAFCAFEWQGAVWVKPSRDQPSFAASGAAITDAPGLASAALGQTILFARFYPPGP